MFGTAWATEAGAAGGQVSGMEALGPFIPLILIFAVFYFLIIRPQSKRNKAHQEYLRNLKRGDRVITGGGIYGQIAAISENVITLEIADDVRIKITRGAVAGSADEIEKQQAPAKTGG